MTTYSTMANWSVNDGWVAVSLMDEWHATDSRLLPELAFSASFPEFIRNNTERKKFKDYWLSAVDSLQLLGSYEDIESYSIRPPIARNGLAFVVEQLELYLQRPHGFRPAKRLLTKLKEVQKYHKDVQETWSNSTGISGEKQVIQKVAKQLTDVLRSVPNIVEKIYEPK